MAAPADKSMGSVGLGIEGSWLAEIVRQLNNVIASQRLITAKLDLDAGVTDTNYAALITDAAIATAPAKLVP